MNKKLILLISVMLMACTISLAANERVDTYYPTTGKYGSDLNHWYNSNHNMKTTSGFVYKKSKNKGDLIKLRNKKLVDNDKVASCVKNADGQVRYGYRSDDSIVELGARRGTDYHKFKE